MAQNVSPGVYTRIIDLSDYVQNVPSTIGFIPIICGMGEDNKLVMTNNRDFFIDYGEPNIMYGGKAFSQGPFIAASFMQQSDSLYIVRCLPDDADYANLTVAVDSTGSVSVDSTTNLNSHSLLDSTIEDATDNLFVFYGLGRGEGYGDFQINISRHINPQLGDPAVTLSNDVIYILDIYRKQRELGDDGQPRYAIINTFNVSLNMNRLDSSGETMWIEDVVNTYSRFIKIKANPIKCLALINSPTFIDISDAFLTGPAGLDNGTSGTLFNINGAIDATVATQILTKAYSGTLISPVNGLELTNVTDTDDTYFSIVLDGGYPTDVKKTGIVQNLALIRQDCIAILDNGDNASPDDALTVRTNTHDFNTKYAALYECYSKVYDMYSGRDIWISPVYHMANIIPYTDNVSELWFAPAGFNRATIGTIKELRFSPALGMRDQFYLNQINPIVKFNVGYTVYSQLTTQKRPTALQDVNVVRLVLYVKRAFEQFCKFYIFEQNNSDTWSKISIEASQFLRQIQNKRGLESFTVEVGATEYELKSKQIHCNVSLSPTKVVEQIFLNFYIM